jgi:acetyltransferase-like isoleucine patch superfamily enzyme
MKKAIWRKSYGNGKFRKKDFFKIGKNVVIEKGVLVFHPENIELGNNIYIGHNTILMGYHKNKMIIKDNTWIGQQCFLHSAGGLEIGEAVGIGPGVIILTSYHDLDENINIPIIHSKIKFKKVIIEDSCDIGAGSIILPGVKIGKGAQIGAGSVVTKNVRPYAVAAGVPAKFLRYRKGYGKR